MKDASEPKKVNRIRFWRLARPAVLCMYGGAALGLLAVALAAFNAVSPQQTVALALPAGVTTIGGLINVHVPDAWAAWRRGFRQGCQAGKLGEMPDVNSDFAELPGRPGWHRRRGG